MIFPFTMLQEYFSQQINLQFTKINKLDCSILSKNEKYQKIKTKGVFILMNIIKMYLMRKNNNLNINQDRVYVLFFIFFCLIFIFAIKIFFVSLKTYDSENFLKSYNNFKPLREMILWIEMEIISPEIFRFIM